MSIDSPLHDPQYRRDLGDGLVVRWSTRADQEALCELYGFVYRGKPEDPPNLRVGHYVRDTLNSKSPIIGANDYAVVEDTRTGKLVATTNLLRQVWEYAGVPLGVGRPEIVATHPEYRNRGLIRAIFDLIHARSEAEGHLVQAITGIEYFYRQFGYEYALDLGGDRSVYLAAIPELKADETESYRLRPATPDDVPLLMMLYDRERTRMENGRPLLVSTRISREYWLWIIKSMNPENAEWYTPQMIENTDGVVQGYVLARRGRWGDALGIGGLAVEPNVSLLTAFPSILRGLRDLATTTLFTGTGEARPVTRLSFALGSSHPVYAAIGTNRTARINPPYAWYVRVPDLIALLRQITPVLERRLSSSMFSGYTGELLLNFYRGGLRLGFKTGKLELIEPWKRPVWGDEGSAGFPPLVFLQVLFGYRSMHDLRHAFPDVWAGDDPAALLDVLFPAQPSWALPLD